MNPLTWPDPASLLDASFSLRLTHSLLHFLWQAALIGGIALTAGWFLRRAAARWRYGVNVASLLLMLGCLPVTFALMPPAPPFVVGDLSPDDKSTARGAAEQSAVGNGGSKSRADRTDDEARPHDGVAASAFTGTIPRDADLPPDRSRFPTERHVAQSVVEPHASSDEYTSQALAAVAPYTAAIYLLGVAAMLFRVMLAVRGGNRLRRSASPLQPAESYLVAMTARQARRIGMKTAPAIAWCRRVSVPVVVGIFRPMILLPVSLATGLRPDQLQALLTHELAHIRRYDLLVNLLQRLSEALLFFHPAVWYVSRRISTERENCCDDFVLDSGCPRVEYADALVRMAELCTATKASRPLPASGTLLAASGASPSQFKRRVLHVLQAEARPRLRLGWGTFALMILLPLTVLSAAAVFSSSTRPAESAADQAANRARQPEGPPATKGAIEPETAAAANGNKLERRDRKGNAPAVEDAPAEEIRPAVKRGVAFLKSQQRADGSWTFSRSESYRIGVTALAALALLESGLDKNDPHVASALRYLAPAEPEYTYEIALQTLVFCRADPKEFKGRIQRNVQRLSKLQNRKRDPGTWGYGDAVPSSRGDNSNTAFALWALDAAAEAGFAADDELWQRSLDGLVAIQQADGGWGYTPVFHRRSIGSMTCSGIAGVAICTDRLARSRREKPPARIAAVEKALKWLEGRFSVETNPGSKRWKHYYLNTLQRAARRAGKERIGPHDWYRTGAAHLVKTQHRDGRWAGEGLEDAPVIATSFALLFLKNGDIALAKGAANRTEGAAKTASSNNWATLTGRFIFDGEPPTPERLNVDKDRPIYGRLDLRDESLLVGDEGGIANIAVFLATDGVKVHPDLDPKDGDPVTITFKDGRLTPRIVPLWVGRQTLQIVNADPVVFNFPDSTGLQV